jgi:hypothetical protein
MATTKRLVDAYKAGDITLAERNSYLNNGKELNDLITIGTPAGLTVGDLDMTTDKITNLGAATAETDAANLANIKQRVAKATVTHDGGAEQTIVTVPAHSRVDKVTIVISETFNGSIGIGDAGDSDRLFANLDIVKTPGNRFNLLAEPWIYATSTPIVATLAENTTGEGTVYVDYVILGV